MADEVAPPRVKTEPPIERDTLEEFRSDSPMIPSPGGMPETCDSWLKRAKHRVKQHKSYTWLSTFAKFIGPGYLIAVGYIDPGNWATDLSAGSQFGYELLWIILLSNIMAVLLQSLCVRLGVVTGLDLAQSCRKHYPKYVNLVLYVLCEIAIIATDLAEVIGSAIALNLLFKIPTIWGVVITAVDVLVILLGWNTKHIRIFEIFIMTLIYACTICLFVLVGKSNPSWGPLLLGYLPSAATFTDSKRLYVAMGIVGATCMPHNLYLHSSIVKFRSGLGNSLGDISEIPEEPDTDSLMVVDRRKHLKQTLHFTYIDSLFALTFALLANSSILIIAAAQLQADKEVSELSDAYALLEQSLGTSAAVLFAFALLCAGQSSTITGTLAGQYVMVGFLGDSFRIAPWLRRLITRSLAIIPALVIVSLFGDAGLNKLLVFSQVILSLQLPFAVWPLVHFTSRKDVMTVRIAKATPNISEPSLQDQDPDFPATRLQPVASTIQIEDQVEEVSYQSPLHFTIVMVMVALIITSFNIVLLIEIGQDGIQ